ncbi:MAG TPA: anti-sigma factor [Terracidiphilus sp.]|nr:anti-sigma factor [Terracidiphilus sp.]
MTERTQFPNSPACGAWETLLADALDGTLRPEDEAEFLEHKASCPFCAALYEEARKGREWLEFLSPEPEAPAGLLEKILAHTGPGHSAHQPIPAFAGSRTVPAFVPPVWQQPGFFARTRQAMQPRLLMTAAMAFFSIALTLNLTGVRLSTLRLADLRPVAMRSYMERQLNMASVPIVRYYDHLRFVYEVESRVRQLREQSESNDNGTPGSDQNQKQQKPVTPGETKQNPGNGGGGRLDPRQQPDNSIVRPAYTNNNELVDTSYHLQSKRGRSNSSVRSAREGSRLWIA